MYHFFLNTLGVLPDALLLEVIVMPVCCNYRQIGINPVMFGKGDKAGRL
jgi:hypothetical protein